MEAQEADKGKRVAGGGLGGSGEVVHGAASGGGAAGRSSGREGRGRRRPTGERTTSNASSTLRQLETTHKLIVGPYSLGKEAFFPGYTVIF